MYVNVYCDQPNAIYHPQYYHKYRWFELSKIGG